MTRTWNERPGLAPWVLARQDAERLLSDAGAGSARSAEVLAAWVGLTRFPAESDALGLWARVDTEARRLEGADVLAAVSTFVDLDALAADLDRFQRCSKDAAVREVPPIGGSAEAIRLVRRVDTERLALIGAWRRPLPDDRRNELALARNRFHQEIVRRVVSRAGDFEDVAALADPFLAAVRADLAEVDPDLGHTLDLWRAIVRTASLEARADAADDDVAAVDAVPDESSED